MDEVAVPADVWTLFEFEIPEGSRHFAVHCNSAIGGMLMLDDISYRGRNLVLTGYNVYRDGELIGNVRSASEGFSEKKPEDNMDHVYNVTALYEEGESGFSNNVFLDGNGVEEISDDAGAAYYDLLGRKLRKPVSGVTIMRRGTESKKIMRH